MNGALGPVEHALEEQAKKQIVELDPAAPVEAKVVEETFRRYARVYDLRVGGQTIRTSSEHSFYAAGLGWTEASSLTTGMELLTASGEWVRVERVDDTGEWEVVYNLRVADHHTYFVGDDTWGWAAWAHNAYMPGADMSFQKVGIAYT